MNFQPDLILMVYWVASSFGVMDSATSLEALPSLSKETRRENSRSTGLPPPVSLVLPGISGFCGSELYAVMMLDQRCHRRQRYCWSRRRRSAAWPRSKPWQRKQELSSSYVSPIPIRLHGRLSLASCERGRISSSSGHLRFPPLRTPNPVAVTCHFCALGRQAAYFCYTHVKFGGFYRLGSVFAKFVNQCPHSGHARGKACP